MDKPVKTRVHELLGVEPGDTFTVERLRGEWWETALDQATLSKYGVINAQEKEYDEFYPTLTLDAINGVCRITNIFRRPTLTDEQREVLLWLHKGGFRWVIFDKSDSGIVAWHCDAAPHHTSDGWGSYNNKGAVWGDKLSCLRPLIPDLTKALDVEKTLRDAGVEV